MRCEHDKVVYFCKCNKEIPQRIKVRLFLLQQDRLLNVHDKLIICIYYLCLV